MHCAVYSLQCVVYSLHIQTKSSQQIITAQAGCRITTQIAIMLIEVALPNT